MALNLQPDLRRADRKSYTAGVVRSLLLDVERWWERQAVGAVETVLRDVRREYARRGRVLRVPEPRLEAPAREALRALAIVGAWSGYRERRSRYAGRGGVPTPFTRLADLPAIPPGELPEGPAPKYLEEMAVTYGIPTQAIDNYAATRVPPIRGASRETQERVRDAVERAVRGGWVPEELAPELQSIGNWAGWRVRNQVRTESGTMFNAGRMLHFSADTAIVGYEYQVTLDDRTTELCQGVAGQKVRADELPWTPPGHYQCRTVLRPLFVWDAPEFDDAGALQVPGDYEGFEGFGQPELTSRVRAMQRAA